MRSSVRRVDVLDAGLLSANSRKTGARRPCATVVLLKNEANRRLGELGPLEGKRRLMDKLDFPASLKSARRDFRAMILNYSIDEPYDSALARNAQVNADGIDWLRDGEIAGRGATRAPKTMRAPSGCLYLAPSKSRL